MVRTGLLTAALLVPVSAFAQPADEKTTSPATQPSPTPEPEEEIPVDEPTAENPSAPRIGDEPIETGPKVPEVRPTGYPVREVLRPITLPDFMSETRFDLRVFPSDFDAELGVRARYGITRQAQVGVRYAIGGFYDDTPSDDDDKVKFNTGKAVGVDFQFLLQDWIAPRISVPMYVDPFAIGLTLGAAVKFRIGDKLALVGFEDVVGFKLTDEFLPKLDNERYNEATARSLTSGTITSRGFLRFDFGAIYQASDDLAISGRFGTTFNDFSDNDTATSLRAQAQFTPRPNVDLIGQIGFEALDESSSLSIGGALQFRI